MSRVEILEQEVSSLTPEELSAIRALFAEFDEAQWDVQLEQDAVNGKLERMAASARRALEEGRTTPL